MRIGLVAKHHFLEGDTIDLLVGTKHGSANDRWNGVSREIISAKTHLKIARTIITNDTRKINVCLLRYHFLQKDIVSYFLFNF